VRGALFARRLVAASAAVLAPSGKTLTPSPFPLASQRGPGPIRALSAELSNVAAT
jgi:hypothetical protein